MSEPEKEKRKRTVFGRVLIEAGGKVVRMEMTREHLIAKPLHCRTRWKMTLKTVAMFVMANGANEKKGYLDRGVSEPSGAVTRQTDLLPASAPVMDKPDQRKKKARLNRVSSKKGHLPDGKPVVRLGADAKTSKKNKGKSDSPHKGT